MRALLIGLGCLALLSGGSAAAPTEHGSAPQGDPINNWQEMKAAFTKCWAVPPETEGSVVAFKFSLTPSGDLRGPPLAMAKVLKGNASAQQQYNDAAYAVLSRCLPFKLTPEFARVMGETPITLRLVNTPRVPSRNMGAYMSIFALEAASNKNRGE